ncbi:MAG: hypothetical protein F6K27_03955 [Okeania sp. SIO2F5]|nr:hypothetical protein [Okeania sp. SIO2F5]
MGWPGDLAISNRPRERCDPATTPARLRNAHQEKKRVYDLKTGIEAIHSDS